jgi:hypothetical protein
VEEASLTAAQVKGSSIGDEILNWTPILSGLREYIEALRHHGQPKPLAIKKHPTRHHPDQIVVEVFPSGLEALVWGGFRGEIWIQPGKPPSQGGIYSYNYNKDDDDDQETRKEKNEKLAGGIALVLGAGNQQAVAALDILHKLVIDNEIVICKMNPINEYQGPFLRRAMLPLVNKGFVEFVYGGPDVGKMLVEHPLVKSVHLTGSEGTYDAIVWGGAQQKEAALKKKRKKGGGGIVVEPPLKKHVGAELGCVTPYIVVPGHWNKEDMEYHAENIAAGLINNAGHNCLKAEIVITDIAWPQREEFLEALRARIDAQYPKYAYYPGSGKKFDDFRKKYPDAEELGRNREGMEDPAADDSSKNNNAVKCSKWLLKTGLSPEQADTRTENWVGVLQEVALPGCNGDASTFLKEAVKFANEQCWGSLSCSLTIHPATRQQHKEAYTQAITDLKYGSITVNLPTLLGFAITRLGWGAWGGGETGGTAESIGSGNCFVHNTMMFEHVEKSVLSGPFRFHPQPPVWSGANRNMDKIGPVLARFTAEPTIWKLLALAGQAALG